MNSTLFDFVFEVTPEKENLSKNLYKRFSEYPFIHGGKDPLFYEISFDNYTNNYTICSNKYDFGLIVTRRDNTKVFLYYVNNKYSSINWFDI